jgi:hypothetical protein
LASRNGEKLVIEIEPGKSDIKQNILNIRNFEVSKIIIIMTNEETRVTTPAKVEDTMNFLRCQIQTVNIPDQ